MTSDLGGLYSLGGCVTHEVARRLASKSRGHIDHFWRRPTIALMSDNVSRFNFNIHDLPSEYINYFINDAAGSHRQEIDSLPSGNTLILDVTRDIFSGVVGLSDNVFLLDPVDSINIVDGLKSDTINYELFEKIIKRKYSVVNYRDSENFEDIWLESFSRFLAHFSAKFRHIFVLEIYLTTEVAHVACPSDLCVDHAAKANAVLSSMYDRVRGLHGCRLVSIDRDKMITGVDVDWGGPTYTHFLNETYALYCDKILSLVSNESQEGLFLKDAAFNRAKAYEAVNAKLKTVTEELAVLQESKYKSEAALKQLVLNLEREKTASVNISEMFRRLSEQNRDRKRVINDLTQELNRRPSNASYEEKAAALERSYIDAQNLVLTVDSLKQNAASARDDLAALQVAYAATCRELERARQTSLAKMKKSVARLTLPLRRSLQGGA